MFHVLCFVIIIDKLIDLCYNYAFSSFPKGILPYHFVNGQRKEITMTKIIATLYLALALCVTACSPSPVNCDLETTHRVGSTCVANDVDPTDHCRPGTHLDGNGCVADDVEIPEEIVCGPCTLLNMSTNTCVADSSCDPEEIDPVLD